MVDTYTIGCIRLVKCLHSQRAAGGRLADYMREQIDRAIKSVNQEWDTERRRALSRTRP